MEAGAKMTQESQRAYVPCHAPWSLGPMATVADLQLGWPLVTVSPRDVAVEFLDETRRGIGDDAV